MRRLPSEDNVTDAELFRFSPEDKDEKRRYRHEKSLENIQERLKDLSAKTGASFPLEANREKIQLAALIKLMEKLEYFNELDFGDMFYIAADESVQNLEKNADSIKMNVISKKVSNQLYIPQGGTLKIAKS